MDPEARAQALARVRALLHEAGATDAEIDAAERDEVLDLLLADRLLVPGGPRYNEKEVEQRTEMPVELARRFWRALGFADVDSDDRVFTDLDVEAIVLIRGLVALGVADIDNGLQLARVIGSSMARIAEAEVSPALAGGQLRAGTASDDSVEAASFLADMADTTLPAMVRLLEFAWRRHVQAATRRAMMLRSRGGGVLPTLCVGFADMVGFTTLSQQLSDEELAVVVSRFEEVAHDTVTAGGGRLVKMIGDEAMFVAESAVAGSRIALALAEAYADDELLSDVRVGMALGPVLAQDGDYFGPVVNLAHRIVNLAHPGTVVLSDDCHAAVLRELHPAGGHRGPQGVATHRAPGAFAGGSDDYGQAAPALEADGDELEDDDEGVAEFAFRSVRPRQIKDVGRVQLWALHRPGAEPREPESRAGRGWERLAEVLRDIDDLRERGERALGAAGIRASMGEADGGDAKGAQSN